MIKMEPKWDEFKMEQVSDKLEGKVTDKDYSLDFLYSENNLDGSEGSFPKKKVKTETTEILGEIEKIPEIVLDIKTETNEIVEEIEKIPEVVLDIKTETNEIVEEIEKIPEIVFDIETETTEILEDINKIPEIGVDEWKSKSEVDLNEEYKQITSSINQEGCQCYVCEYGTKRKRDLN